MENKLDRIMIGSLENKENLEEKGKVCFNLYVEIGEYSVFQRKFINSYGITGKLSSGEKIWGQHIGCRKRPDKQEFLKEVNDDLNQMNCYLAETEYSKRFPTFWLHKVKGILYKEKTK